MESEHFIGKVAQKALIERDGRVLLARGKEDELWDIPGGRIHRGEKPDNALAREIKEELDVDVVVGTPFFVDLIKATKTGEERYFICFHVDIPAGQEPRVTDPEESAELLWITKDEVATVPTYEVCRDALKVHFGKI